MGKSSEETAADRRSAAAGLAAEYRQRAVECIEVAKRMSLPKEREAMMESAQSWVRMADRRNPRQRKFKGRRRAYGDGGLGRPIKIRSSSFFGCLCCCC